MCRSNHSYYRLHNNNNNDSNNNNSTLIRFNRQSQVKKTLMQKEDIFSKTRNERLEIKF